ncbi:sulfite reductase subunit alpha [Xanthomonas campestris pv. campestris]|nr:sulfite reductase subunit alpha [Xanthomonas campestris pv. campestris]
MSLASPRVWLGNGVILLALAVLAAWLGSLHAGPWWSAPAPHRWHWAGLSLAAYAIVCFGLWLRGRPRVAAARGDDSNLLIAWASQTGFARELAERSATALQQAGVGAHALPLDALDANQLSRVPRLLCIVSTTGEGDAPDHVQAAERTWLGGSDTDLAALRYAVLALGDRRYAQFCAFGRRLDARLQAQGATPLFARIEVDNAEPQSLQQWQQRLAELAPALAMQADWSVPSYADWQLQQRVHVNPGSAGAAVYRLRLIPCDGHLPQWSAGDIAEIRPQHSPQVVEAWLQRRRLDGTQQVQGRSLHAWLSGATLPDDSPDTTSLDAWVHTLAALPHRDYSLASLPDEGHAELLIRQHLHADGTPGLGSGWLCQAAPIGARIALRVRTNPGFHPPAAAQPMLLIGNGTGIAGLRAHLRARIAAGARHNWLLFGERNAAYDTLYGDEVEHWQRDGWIERLDRVYSRDSSQPHRYVQHALAAAAADVHAWVAQGACVYVCGSLRGMAHEVDATLDSILGTDLKQALLSNGRYRRDVY